MEIEKRKELIELFDIYGLLLTDKQQEYFKMYYFYDLSFAEIAEDFKISRNGVFDQIKKAINNLNNFEMILNINKKNKKILEILSDETILEKVKAIIEE